MPERAYSSEEVTRRGRALYDERVRPNVNEKAQRGAFVAIDTETGKFELGDNKLEVMDRLEEHYPEARGRIWLTRVGLEYGVRFGGRRIGEES